ncbi:hypothetical protein ACO1O0_005924 [Amphichorda felina]
MHVHPRPSSRSEFEIAIICALGAEADAVCYVFDQFWDENGHQYGRALGDFNHYTTGRIGHHNVVLALLPNMGKAGAAGAAASLRSSYHNVRLALVVGVCGAVPYSQEGDVLLGDVVISTTVVQHDFGSQYTDRFVRKDTVLDNLGRPNKDVRSLLMALGMGRERDRMERQTVNFLQQIQAKASQSRRDWNTKYVYPVHQGASASGDMVIKSANTRDRLAREEGVVMLEMEGAGVWEEFPCIVVKGVCDYGDSHKNKSWQSYAAATAAAASKAILERYTKTERPVSETQTQFQHRSPSSPDHRNESRVSSHGPVFNGPISGTNVVAGTTTTGGVVNFNFGQPQ